MKRLLWLAVIVVVAPVGDALAVLTTNSWTNSVSGKWEAAGNWSVGVPASTQAVILVTNAASKTVTINSATPAGNLTISNLTLRGFGSGTNTLQITNAPARTLLIHNQLTVGTNAVLRLTNSTLQVDGLSAGVISIDGVVMFDSGTVIANNASVNMSIGNIGRGSFTMKAGSLLSYRLIAGSAAGNPGTFSIAGGTNSIVTQANIAFAANSTGTVWVTGGLLEVVEDRIDVGGLGTGTMTISNGIVRTVRQNVGSQGRGTLTVAGGSNVVSDTWAIGTFADATGTVWVTGGQVLVTNAASVVASNGVGQLTISNGVLRTAQFVVGASTGSRGTFTMAGGSLTVGGLWKVGASSAATGTVWITGGQILSSFQFIGDNFAAAQLTMSNGLMTVSNCTVGAVGPGTFTMAGGTNVITTALNLSSSSVGNGTYWLVGSNALVVATNANVTIGGGGTGVMTISNGTLLARQTFVSGRGTLTVAGGRLASTNLSIGTATTTGTVWVTGGLLVITNTPATVGTGTGFIVDGSVLLQLGSLTISNVAVNVGNFGSGSLTVNGGSFLANNMTVGNDNPGVVGTATFAGGTSRLIGALTIASAGATGTVWLTGGQLVITNQSATIGATGIGFIIISNGTWLARNVNVGIGGPGVRGTLDIAGGTTSVSSNLTLGRANCSASGNLTIEGGTIAVTNTAGTAVLDIESGTLTQTGGTLIMDNLIITNPCARYVKTGGSFQIKTTITFNPNGDADGDGIPNQYEIDNGLLIFDPRDAAQDKDGDGLSNLEEFLAGTSPTNAASAFRITAVTREANNMRVTWMMAPGKTNALERTAGAAGSFSNNFAAIFTATNTVGTTTNYLDVGAATNVPAFYYRVRLVP